MKIIKYIKVIIVMKIMKVKNNIADSKTDLTTVSLYRSTYEQLNTFRHGGESWDNFFKRIINERNAEKR